MNMRIPLEASAKCMKNANKARGKVFGFIHFVKQIENGIANSVEEAVKEFTVFMKKGRSSSGKVKTQCL